jgi:hypothetical protein
LAVSANRLPSHKTSFTKNEHPRLRQRPPRAVHGAISGRCRLAAVGATREDAVTGLRLKVREKLDSGELTTIEVGTWTDLAGEYIDDPTLDLISQEAYEAREVESAE